MGNSKKIANNILELVGKTPLVKLDKITSALKGEYYAKIPEWVVNDMNWYEDTNIHFKVDGNEVIITETD